MNFVLRARVLLGQLCHVALGTESESGFCDGLGLLVDVRPNAVGHHFSYPGGFSYRLNFKCGVICYVKVHSTLVSGAYVPPSPPGGMKWTLKLTNHRRREDI